MLDNSGSSTPRKRTETHLSWHLQVALDHCPACLGSHCHRGAKVEQPCLPGDPRCQPPGAGTRRPWAKKALCCSIVGTETSGSHIHRSRSLQHVVGRECPHSTSSCRKTSRLQFPRMGSLYLSGTRSPSRHPAAKLVAEQLKGRVRQTVSERKCRREVRVPSGPGLQALHLLGLHCTAAGPVACAQAFGVVHDPFVHPKGI